MDRSWMSESRLSAAYLDGVNEFLNLAFSRASVGGRILCPCSECKNTMWVARTEASHHLIWNGFIKGYTKWIEHGEGTSSNSEGASSGLHGTRTQETSEFCHDMHGMLNDRFGLSDKGGFDDEAENVVADEPNKVADDFYKLLKNAERELYPGCKTDSTLSFLVELFNIKCLGKWTDHSFSMLLDLLKRVLPSGETLPKSNYEMKKMLKSLNLSYNKIDACPNDCMLYWKENLNDSECHVCHTSRWATDNDGAEGERSSKKVAAKVLRHFPLIPRLQQLFMSTKTSSLMRWHMERRTKDGCMRHPADSPAWKTFDFKHRDFAKDARNVRLGLATDGFNPFRTLSSTYSTWPVVLMPYNLPPWLCMKEPYFMLSLLIPGPSAPGNNIDVYLQPLIEELKLLWEVGVETYDVSAKRNFQMRAMLLWTISDFPAYAYLSGWSTKGALACPSCQKNTDSRWLYHSGKHCYMGHRRFLDDNHPFRKNKQSFDGAVDYRKAPPSISGDTVLGDLEGFVHKYGKLVDDNPKLPFNYKKQSIFYELPYWKDNLVRHNLDVMHIEKNVCEAIIATLLNLDKTKDHHKARLDLQDMGIRVDLHPQLNESGRTYLPPSLHSMDKKEKAIFCKVLKKIKVPDGYASNISRGVQLKQQKISALKSHDYHILMQQILPLALRRVLPKKVRSALINLCQFFRELCSKVLQPRELIKLEAQIAKTLCELETIFPPSFFDVMMHLPIHLATEARLAGPVQYRWMYPVERYLGTLKSYVRNRSRPEGSIAEGYLAHECITFCSRYLNDVETKLNRVSRNDDAGDTIMTQLSIFSRPGHPIGAKNLVVSFDQEILTKAHHYVLFNCDAVNPYILKHEEEIRNQYPRARPRDIARIQNAEFASWFNKHVLDMLISNEEEISDGLKDLAQGPHEVGKRYKGFVINGFSFHIREVEKKRKYQNSGVVTTATTTSFSSARDNNPISGDVTYYGILNDIIELEYPGSNKIVLFKCDWVAEGKRKKHDEHGFTLVNFTGLREHNEPFVFASQVQQVFYAEDPIDKGWHVVIKTTARDNFDMSAELGIEDVESYVQADTSTVRLANDSDEISWVRGGVEGTIIDLDAM